MPHVALRSYAVRFSLVFVFFLALAAPASAADEANAAAPTAASREKKAENRIPGPMVLPQGWPGGEVMPAGLTAVMNHFSWSEAKLYKGSSRYNYKTPMGTRAGPRRLEQFVNVFKIRHSFTDRFEVRTATPYINAEVKNHGTDGGWKGGLGDTTLMLRYGLKKRTEDSPISFAVDLGVTLPTGHVGDQDKYLATNAFSLIAGGGFSWVDNNQRVDLDARHAVYREGAHGIKPGDFTLFHAHYAYALTRNFDIGMEAYYRHEQAGEVHGKSQHDAWQEAYIGPKVQFKKPEWAYMMVGAAVLFPAYRHSDAPRFSTDTRYEMSILFAF